MEEEPAREPGSGDAARRGGSAASGLRGAGAGAARAVSYVFRQARRASRAEGAGETGLFRVIELHALNAAGDTAVAVGLAGTLFFQVPTEQARSQVALFLGLTMLPFALVAPLIGPVLDRFSHGRRWAIGITMALRAFLCWVLAGQVVEGSLAMFPAALGVLVASKAYGVTRAASVPRVTPPRLGLVKANSRISLAGVAGAGVSVPLAVAASLAGPEWTLRYAFLVFIGATVLAILLPAAVDDTSGEGEGRLVGDTGVTVRGGLGGRLLGSEPVPWLVVRALRCNAGLRLLSGFLTLFMAFLLRAEPLPGWEQRPELLLALVVGAAGLGNTAGIALGSVLRDVRPAVVVLVVLLADTALTLTAAAAYGLVTVLLLALSAGVCQSLGKLSLDSLIQSEVPERTRSSTFARSETLLQLSWVLGGFLGIALPLVPRVGLGVAGAVLVGLAAWVLTSTGRRARSRSV